MTPILTHRAATFDGCPLTVAEAEVHRAAMPLTALDQFDELEIALVRAEERLDEAVFGTEVYDHAATLAHYARRDLEKIKADIRARFAAVFPGCAISEMAERGL